MIAELLHTMRELHRRSNDGIDVRLLWSEHDGQVLVAVATERPARSSRSRCARTTGRWTFSITRSPTPSAPCRWGRNP